MKTTIPAAAFLAALTGMAVRGRHADRYSRKASILSPPPSPGPAATSRAAAAMAMRNEDNTVVTDPGGVSLVEETTAGGRGWFGTVQGGCDYQSMSAG